MKRKIKLIPAERTNRLGLLLRENWQPKPITKPKVDPALKKLTGIQRGAEVMRHSVLSFEFWISPFGRLREWVRLNSKISAILFVPAVLVLPLIGWIIYQIAGWFSMLVGLAAHLILFPILALIAVAVLGVVITVLRAISGK